MSVSQTRCHQREGNVREHEDGANNPGNDTERAEDPSEVGLDVDGSESEIDGGGEGGLELRESHDDGLHALGCLGVGILKRGDGGLMRRSAREPKPCIT